MWGETSPVMPPFWAKSVIISGSDKINQRIFVGLSPLLFTHRIVSHAMPPSRRNSRLVSDFFGAFFSVCVDVCLEMRGRIEFLLDYHALPSCDDGESHISRAMPWAYLLGIRASCVWYRVTSGRDLN